MQERVARLPLIVLLMAVGAAAMLVPAVYAISLREWSDARAFGYSALIFLGVCAMLAVTVSNYAPRRHTRSHLLALLTAYVLLPLMLAVPIYEAMGDTRFLNAYFEMVSSLTTTGATVYGGPERGSGAIHLWRALVGWMGGFLVWVAAIAIMAPVNLGGFEVLAIRDRTGQSSNILKVADPGERIRRYAITLFPIYATLTLALWVALLVAGNAPLLAICHAMSTLSTSGISPGSTRLQGGFITELLILLFLAFALSRRTFEREGNIRRRRRLLQDPELRMALALVLLVPSFLFLRHWWGALDVEAEESLLQAMRALWGSIFTVLSFLTTTGFESAFWEDTRRWSGLETPGLVLVGLSIIGGGVATTAGGVKLLRVYALYTHGRRETEKLVHPSSVGGQGATARHLRTRGAMIAWIFFMLFAMSIAAVMMALALTGLQFEPSMVLAIAALSNTGPLATMGHDVPLSYASLSDVAKLILAATMVLGRLETLVIVALLNPEFWRG